LKVKTLLEHGIFVITEIDPLVTMILKVGMTEVHVHDNFGGADNFNYFDCLVLNRLAVKHIATLVHTRLVPLAKNSLLVNFFVVNVLPKSNTLGAIPLLVMIGAILFKLSEIFQVKIPFNVVGALDLPCSHVPTGQRLTLV
jgi:hypothetical protein